MNTFTFSMFWGIILNHVVAYIIRDDRYFSHKQTIQSESIVLNERDGEVVAYIVF